VTYTIGKKGHHPSRVSQGNHRKRDEGVQFLFTLVFFILAFFYYSFLSTEANLGADAAVYVKHAQNLAWGNDYSQTGFVSNPYFLTIKGPFSYPPGYPLILAPVIKYFGMDWGWLRAATVSFFLGSLIVVILFWRKELGMLIIGGIALLVALNPWCWEFRNNLVSDMPYLFFTFSALLWGERRKKSADKSWFWNAVIFGILCSLAFWIRSIGIVLLPSYVIFCAWERKKLFPESLIWVSLTIFVLLFVVQNTAFPRESYLSSLLQIWGKQKVLQNLREYPVAMGQIFFGGWGQSHLKLIVSGLFSIFSFAGFVGAIREKVTFKDIYFIFYLGIIFLWPAYQGERFLLPILPILLFYFFKGMSLLPLKKIKLQGIMVVALVILLGGYVVEYKRIHSRPIDLSRQEADREMVYFVKQETDADAVFLVDKFRQFGFFTHRKTSPFRLISSDNLWVLMTEIDVRYIVLGLSSDRGYFQNNPEYFTTIFKNSQWNIFEITAFPSIRGGSQTARKK